MGKTSTEWNPHVALLAYKLGYAPVTLELEARWRWEMAGLAEEPFLERDSGEKEPGWTEDASPFPVELARYLREMQEAGEALIDCLPRSSRGRLAEGLAKASEEAWRAYEKAWLGPIHRAKISEREEAEADVNMLTASPFVEPTWRDYRRAAQQFADSLPEPLRTWASLGAHLAAVDATMPPTYRQNPLPEQVSPFPYGAAAELFRSLKQQSSILEGVEPLSDGDWLGRRKQAKSLHEQIFSRLSESEKDVEGGQERWKTASQAEIVAKGMGVSLSVSWIGRIADRLPPPFKSRRRGGRGRDIEMVSFLSYLLEKHKHASDKAALRGTGHPKEHPDSDIKTQIDDMEKQEKDAREKLIEVAKQARGKPAKG